MSSHVSIIDRIAQLRSDGQNNTEIAVKLGIAIGMVEAAQKMPIYRNILKEAEKKKT